MDDSSSASIDKQEKQAPLQNLNEDEIVKRSNIQAVENPDNESQNPVNGNVECEESMAIDDESQQQSSSTSASEGSEVNTNMNNNKCNDTLENSNKTIVSTNNDPEQVDNTNKARSEKDETILEKVSQAQEKDTDDDVVLETLDPTLEKAEKILKEVSRMQENGDIVLEKVKEEPSGEDYEKASGMYRNAAPVVVHNSSDDSSSSSSSDEDDEVPATQLLSDDSDEESVNPNDTEEIREQKRAAQMMLRKKSSKTAGEVFPEDLPPMEYLTLTPGEEVKLEPLGEVTGVVGVLVVVKAKPNTPALYDDTVLFSESRQPLGLIFEVFGTVEKPYYSIRFNKAEDIASKDISIGDTIMYAPTADNITKYVFIKELESMKYNDASWENDNEPPPQHRDYSDDEEEARAKALMKEERIKRAKANGADIKEEVTDGPVKRRQKRRRPEQQQQQQQQQRNDGENGGGPGLLQGDLTRNPFGVRPFSASDGQSQRPPRNFTQTTQQAPLPARFPPGPPGPAFGQQPQWDHYGNRFPGGPAFNYSNNNNNMPPGSAWQGPQPSFSPAPPGPGSYGQPPQQGPSGPNNQWSNHGPPPSAQSSNLGPPQGSGSNYGQYPPQYQGQNQGPPNQWSNPGPYYGQPPPSQGPNQWGGPNPSSNQGYNMGPNYGQSQGSNYNNMPPFGSHQSCAPSPQTDVWRGPLPNGPPSFPSQGPPPNHFSSNNYQPSR